MSAGIVTAVPLLCFGAAAIRVPMVTLGLLQYLAPILQFLLGVLWFHEDMSTGRWIGFALVWVALAIFTVEVDTPPPPAAAEARADVGRHEQARWLAARLELQTALARVSAGTRVATMSANSSRAVRTGPSGTAASCGLGLGGAGDDVGAGLVDGGVPAQQGEGLGVQGVVGERPSSSSISRASSGPAVARAMSTGSVGTPSRRSVPGVLPETPDSEATSRMSSESWKAAPTISPYSVRASSTSGVAPPKHRAVARRGGDQRAGLAGDDVEVVLERVLAGAGLDGLEDLALDQAR